MNPYYEDENVTIYHGDCRDITLPTASVDLLITDPPYGIDWKSRGAHGKIAGDKDNLWLKDAMKHTLKVLRVHRHFYVFGPDVVSDLTVCPSVELIWDKGRMSASGTSDIPWSPGHERITFAMYSPFKSHRNTGAGAVRLRRSTVMHIPKKNNGRGSFVHPNEKPVPLMRVMVEASSQFGETVFDPFAGSGATVVAAVLEGRKAVAIEIDEKYCEVIAKRVSNIIIGDERRAND
ncbi:COG0863 DNA modification methylase [uncultured Caudovirales phage]|uniref:COG0863 DNA modification methylase n=1 Tax=uncultured Caudovirales phage TaxID=2100421 RepID=A0A6J5R8V6_9CAUD|nr:COG0863 DNA modification methylase [uncultured Caudovirales phage]